MHLVKLLANLRTIILSRPDANASNSVPGHTSIINQSAISPHSIVRSTLQTIGYPNYEGDEPLPQFDLQKWMHALKEIHIKAHFGTREGAIKTVIGSWDRMEQRNFLDWMKYYESGDILKYKKAQNAYFESSIPGYHLPVGFRPPAPIMSSPTDIPAQAQEIVQSKPDELPEAEKRKLVEDLRKRLMGRLNAAEKLLTSTTGHMFAGPEFEKLLIAISDLKRQIQLVNRVSKSASIQSAIDLIIRQANILTAQGAPNAAAFMVKLAQQTPGAGQAQWGDIPMAGSQPQGLGSLPNNMPAPQNLGLQPDDGYGNGDDAPKDGLAGFMANLNGDQSEADDDIDLGDDVEMDDADDSISLDDADDDLVVEAQMLPEEPHPEMPRRPRPERREPDLKPVGRPDAIGDQHPGNGQKEPTKDHIDGIIDAAFAGVKTSDLIEKLNDIANIFRNREISRQLSIADMMMARLGINQYFPELAEVQNKNLESGNYILTRLETVLSRLRGTLDKKEIDLDADERQVSPEAAGLASSLKQKDDQEKARKDMKKQLETQQLEEKMKPEGEVEGVGEELGAEQPVLERETAPRQMPQPPRQAVGV